MHNILILNFRILWIIAPCSPYFRETYRVHVQGRHSAEQGSSVQQVARQSTCGLHGATSQKMSTFRTAAGEPQILRSNLGSFWKLHWIKIWQGSELSPREAKRNEERGGEEWGTDTEPHECYICSHLFSSLPWSIVKGKGAITEDKQRSGDEECWIWDSVHLLQVVSNKYLQALSVVVYWALSIQVFSPTAPQSRRLLHKLSLALLLSTCLHCSIVPIYLAELRHTHGISQSYTEKISSWQANSISADQDIPPLLPKSRAHTLSADSSVCTAPCKRLQGRVSIPDKGKIFFSNTQRPLRLWVMTSLLHNGNGYWGFSKRLTIHFHLVNGGPTFSFLHVFSWHTAYKYAQGRLNPFLGTLQCS